MVAQIADDIWHGGIIETMDRGRTVAQAMAIKDGRILAVGSDADMLDLAGPKTRRHALGGSYVLPGLVESHAHALWGSCRELFDVHVGYQAGFDQLITAVRERTVGLAPGMVVLGGPWRLDMRSAMGANPRLVLDEVTSAHPVILQDATCHSLWCNSQALQRTGLSASSPDVDGGVIERDPRTGEPTGILTENACLLAKDLMQRTETQLQEASRHFVAYFNQLGITAFKEPMACEPDLNAYKTADERGDLTLHMAAHLVRSSPFTHDNTAYETMEAWRRSYASANVRTSFAKLFLDGVAPSRTASFLEPYLPATGYDAVAHDPDGTLLISPGELNDTVTKLDRRGFVVKMHAVGDNAVRKGLDAIEAARTRNGQSGLRHEIAHCAFVHPTDLPRFKSLGAIAEVSPKLWFPNPVTAGQISVLGRERVERCHPIGDLLRAGAEVTYASDWPAAAPDANPWIGLAGMISRRDPRGRFPGTLGADQAIPLESALPIFTINGARSLGMAAETGSLERGKWADFILLERALDQQSPEEIGATEVLETYWKGRCVFQK